MKKASLLSFLTISGVASAYAQASVSVSVTAGDTTAPGQGLINLLKLVETLIGYAGPILMSLAVLAFFFGLTMFIWKGKESEDKRKGWMAFMGWSLVAIFAMVSVWGIVAFIGSTLGVTSQSTIPTPKLPIQFN